MSEYGIVTVQIRRHADGLYAATSPDLAGVFVAHRDLNAILDDMPEIIRVWFERNKNQQIEVFSASPKHYDDTTSRQFIPVPAEIAAQHLGR